MPNFRESQEVQRLADYIRQLWWEEHQDFELRTKAISTGKGSRHSAWSDGGVDDRGVHHEPVWPKIARLCLANALQPETLVAAMFYREERAPQPSQAVGAHALAKYQRYREPAARQELRMNIQNDFESQKSYVAAGIRSLCQYGGKTEDVAIREIVLTPTNMLSQLFRYCVLKNRNRPIAEDYAEVAFREYRRHADLYDEIWGDWIPLELRTRFTQWKGGSK